MAEPTTAVVTVTYRSADDIDDFLASVTASGHIGPVTVVDNPSPESDETEAVARRHGATVIRLPKNVGYGGAIDAGVAQLPVGIEAIVIANPDVRFEAGAIATLVAVFDADPKVASIGPHILNSDGSTYPSARRIPSIRAGAGHAVFVRWWPSNPWTRSYRQERAPVGEPRDVGWLSGACLAVRRSAFTEVGGFDPGYFMYFEDVDLGYSFGKAGWLNRYEPRATVTHIGATSTSQESGRMLREHHRSAQRFLARKYHGWYLLPVRLALRAGLGVRAWWLTRGWE